MVKRKRANSNLGEQLTGIGDWLSGNKQGKGMVKNARKLKSSAYGKARSRPKGTPRAKYK